MKNGLILLMVMFFVGALAACAGAAEKPAPADASDAVVTPEVTDDEMAGDDAIANEEPSDMDDDSFENAYLEGPTKDVF